MLMNNISVFRNILAGKEMKNLSLPSPLTEFQKFYNNHNAVDKKVVMYGQSTRDQGWFNRTYLQLMKKKISGTELKNLTLPSALVDFERFYNTHSNIDNSVVQYGNFTNRQGWFLENFLDVVSFAFTGTCCNNVSYLWSSRYALYIASLLKTDS